MDYLVVDSQLVTVIADDEDTNAATAVVKGLGEPVEKVALVENAKALLNIAGLGHSDNTAVVTDIKNTVLLEDRAEHVLDDDGR
jgi:hypothetical protein